VNLYLYNVGVGILSRVAVVGSTEQLAGRFSSRRVLFFIVTIHRDFRRGRPACLPPCSELVGQSESPRRAIPTYDDKCLADSPVVSGVVPPFDVADSVTGEFEVSPFSRKRLWASGSPEYLPRRIMCAESVQKHLWVGWHRAYTSRSTSRNG
jgi:hypothetical protein